MFKERLEECVSAVQQRLDTAIGLLPQGPVRDAMGHACSGGKRLRAFLVLEGGRLYGVDADQSLDAAAAVEAIHAYSLVHDDLPAMDDDDLRRGRPTVHVKWDEATAVLVGDALQALGFELVAASDIKPERVVSLIASLAKASGAAGMVRGQVLDIAAETATPRYVLDMVEETQALKTGALIEWSAMAGPRLAGADPGHMQTYAAALGRAFQIADDILDVEGDAAAAGKRLGKDAAAGKATFVSLLGIDGAKKRAKTLVEEAEAALETFGSDADVLRETARFVISRKS